MLFVALLALAACTPFTVAVPAEEGVAATVPEPTFTPRDEGECCNWVEGQWGECLCPMTAKPYGNTTIYSPKYTNAPAPSADCDCVCCDEYA